MQVKVEGNDKTVKTDSTKINKMIADLEAHINTTLITEKSVRKA